MVINYQKFDLDLEGRTEKDIGDHIAPLNLREVLDTARVELTAKGYIFIEATQKTCRLPEWVMMGGLEGVTHDTIQKEFYGAARELPLLYVVSETGCQS